MKEFHDIDGIWGKMTEGPLLVHSNHIALEMSGALTKVLPRQCGGKYLRFALYMQKGQ